MLRVGVAGTTESLDPHLDGRLQRLLVTHSVFDGLLARGYLAGDPPGTGAGLAPALATGWRRIDDLTLEVTLRDEVVFHDGAPMTTDDVKFTLEVLRGSGSEYATAKLMFETIAGVEVIDPATVRLMTTNPDPVLEKRLTSWYGWITSRRDFEAVGPEAFGQKPTGTGPYKVAEFRPDDALILEAHDQFWGGRPTAARIEFRVIPEIAARIAALVSGEIDIAASIPPDQVATINDADGFEVRGLPVANIRVITFNTRHPAMRDRRFRQALGLAVDRQLIVDQLWSGLASVPRGFQYPNYGELYNQQRPYPTYDPVAARRLIQESGYDGRPIPLWTPADYYILGEEVAQAVAAMWQEVGVAVELSAGPVAEFYDRLDEKAALSGSWGNELGDPDQWWGNLGKGSVTDEFLWTPDNPRFNELGQRARETLDAQTRFDAYQEMIDIWDEEAPGIVLYSPADLHGVREEISWQPYSFFYMDFRPDNLRFITGP